ncbi:MAG: hypothetical protein OEW12_08020 [Deltaproteobacteria bacterium]|nr:hypothetical protein [Deltaproteobacteria bacterium]
MAQLNKESYGWLGSNFLHYNKIRTAQKGQSHFFEGAQLEEQMEATRSALTFVTRALSNNLILAYNSLIDSVKNAGQAPPDWPSRIDVPDRNNPPNLTNEQDALIIAWMPLKFFNLSRTVREKGKGIETYADGVIKKLYFKVLGYYCDPSHWDPNRMGYFLNGIPEDATLPDINAKLSTLKSEVEAFAASYQMLRFGKTPRAGADPSAANTLEDMFEVSKEEMAMDLYFQNFLVSGMDAFIFRYYMTLVSYTQNSRAIRAISQIFESALSRTTNIRITFQSSLSMEREKIRVRKEYQELFQKLAELPMVEEVPVKGGMARKINYSLKLLDVMAFPRSSALTPRQAQPWKEWLTTHVLSNPESPHSYALLVEAMNMLVHSTQFDVEGKLQVVRALREFADMQEKQGNRQMSLMRQKFAADKTKKQREVSKFKRMEQSQVVDTVKEEMETAEYDAKMELEKMGLMIAQRKESQLKRAAELEASALKDGQQNLGKNAASVYQLISGLDPENKLRIGYVGHLLRQIQNDNDMQYLNFYKHLFGMMHDLSPTEKVVLRKAVESKISLQPDEMVLSQEEIAQFQNQVNTAITELNMEMPGILDQKMIQGQVRASVEQLLKVGLTGTSFRLLLMLPFNAPNKPPAKIPPAIAQKLLRVNQLMNPFPVEDIIFTNVDPAQPVIKRLNFNRLSKSLGASA